MRSVAARWASARRGSLPTADLREAAWAVSVNTVAQIMAELGLVARPKKRHRSTTRPGKGRWRAPNLVKRDFGADRINHKWYGDGTAIPTGEGKLDLDSVLDMGSRHIVGFAVGEHHDAALSTAALQMAVAVRAGRPAGHRRRPVPLGTRRIYRWRLPGGLRAVRYHPIDGPSGIGVGQCRGRIVALDRGIRTASQVPLHDEGREQSRGGHVDPGVQPRPQALVLRLVPAATGLDRLGPILEQAWKIAGQPPRAGQHGWRPFEDLPSATQDHLLEAATAVMALRSCRLTGRGHDAPCFLSPGDAANVAEDGHAQDPAGRQQSGRHAGTSRGIPPVPRARSSGHYAPSRSDADPPSAASHQRRSTD